MSLRITERRVGMEADHTLRRRGSKAGGAFAGCDVPTDQSLPEKIRVLCPPGTRGFREPFFCADILPVRLLGSPKLVYSL